MFGVEDLNKNDHPAILGLLKNAEFSSGSGLSVDDYVGFMIDDHACYDSYYEEMEGLDEQGREVVVAELRERLA